MSRPLRIALRIASLGRTFFRVSWSDKWLLLQAAAGILIVRIGLWVLPFRTMVRLFQRHQEEEGTLTVEQLKRQRRIVWAVSAVGHRVLRKRPCLTEAFVAQHMLRVAGIPTRLRIGVQKDDRTGFAAHAWLEREGYVVIGGADSPTRFVPLPPISLGR